MSTLRPPRRLLPRRTRPKPPRLAPRQIALLALLAIALTATLVFIFDHHPLLHELTLTLALTAAALFVFLTIGLYRGLRLHNEQVVVAREPIDIQRVANAMPDVEPATAVDAIGLAAELEFPGCLLGAVLAILWLIGGVLILWLLLNFFWVVLPLFALALYYLFHRATRAIFRHKRRTRGHLPLSLAYALLYTTLYTSWLFALLFTLSRLRR